MFYTVAGTLNSGEVQGRLFRGQRGGTPAMSGRIPLGSLRRSTSRATPEASRHPTKGSLCARGAVLMLAATVEEAAIWMAAERPAESWPVSVEMRLRPDLPVLTDGKRPDLPRTRPETGGTRADSWLRRPGCRWLAGHPGSGSPLGGRMPAISRLLRVPVESLGLAAVRRARISGDGLARVFPRPDHRCPGPPRWFRGNTGPPV